MLNLGSTITVLVLGRVLQGISAAVVWVVGLALLADTVDESEIGQTMGYVFFAMSVAVLLGPLLGGVVFEKGSYNDVYAMAYVLIGIDIALRCLMIEKKVAKKWEKTEAREDAVQTATIEEPNSSSPKDEALTSNRPAPPPTDLEVETVSPISHPDEEHPPTNPSSPAKRKVPALWTLVKSRRLLCALWGCIVVSTLMTQFDSVLPIYVEETFGWSSLGAGLIFVPLLIPSFLSPIVGWAIDKYGPRWFAVAGFIAFVPFEVLLRLVTYNSLNQKVLLCALLAFIGVALNLAMPPIMVEISYVVEQKERQTPGLFGAKGAYAQAYGLFNFAWALGCLVGPIWAGFVRERAGWGTMGWTLALLSLVTAVPAGIWTGGSIWRKGKRRENMLAEQRLGVEMEGRVAGREDNV
jgi:MFS family permease